MRNYPLELLKKEEKYYRERANYWKKAMDKKLYLVVKLDMSASTGVKTKRLYAKYLNIANQYRDAYLILKKLEKQ